MTKFVVFLKKADVMALSINKPVDIYIDGDHGILCTEEYYLKNIVNQLEGEEEK